MDGFHGSKMNKSSKSTIAGTSYTTADRSIADIGSSTAGGSSSSTARAYTTEESNGRVQDNGTIEGTSTAQANDGWNCRVKHPFPLVFRDQIAKERDFLYKKIRYFQYDELIRELETECIHCEPWEKEGVPSTVWCIIWKLSLIPLTLDQLQTLFRHEQGLVRATALIYVRLLLDPAVAWRFAQKSFFDETPVKPYKLDSVYIDDIEDHSDEEENSSYGEDDDEDRDDESSSGSGADSGDEDGQKKDGDSADEYGGGSKKERKQNTKTKDKRLCMTMGEFALEIFLEEKFDKDFPRIPLPMKRMMGPRLLEVTHFRRRLAQNHQKEEEFKAKHTNVEVNWGFQLDLPTIEKREEEVISENGELILVKKTVAVDNFLPKKSGAEGIWVQGKIVRFDDEAETDFCDVRVLPSPQNKPLLEAQPAPYFPNLIMYQKENRDGSKTYSVHMGLVVITSAAPVESSDSETDGSDVAFVSSDSEGAIAQSNQKFKHPKIADFSRSKGYPWADLERKYRRKQQKKFVTDDRRDVQKARGRTGFALKRQREGQREEEPDNVVVVKRQRNSPIRAPTTAAELAQKEKLNILEARYTQQAGIKKQRSSSHDLDFF